MQILITIPNDYRPENSDLLEENTPFMMVTAALEHFEIPATVSVLEEKSEDKTSKIVRRYLACFYKSSAQTFNKRRFDIQDKFHLSVEILKDEEILESKCVAFFVFLRRTDDDANPVLITDTRYFANSKFERAVCKDFCESNFFLLKHKLRELMLSDSIRDQWLDKFEKPFQIVLKEIVEE